MDKKKKIILISVIIIAILAIIGVICLFSFRGKGILKSENTEKVKALYEELKEMETYSFTTVLDNNNKETYVKKPNMAYIESLYKGNLSKYLIKDGNTYLLKDDTKAYYTYANNVINLNKIEETLAVLLNYDHTTGEEEVNGKEYKYEQFNAKTNLTFMSSTEIESSETVSTKFYFKGNDIAYIKTIAGDKEELLEIKISNKVDNNLFKIPSDYEQK